MSFEPELMYGVGAALLGAVLAYGLISYQRRDKSRDARNRAASHRATYAENTPDDKAEPPAPDEATKRGR